MKKDLDYYLSLPYRMVITPDTEEGGFTVLCPELPGCITCVENIDDVFPMFNDAKKCWLEAALKEGIEINEPIPEESYSGQFKIRMPKSLHKSLAEHSKQEGISMNQYCLYLLAKNDAVYNISN
ncbi:MAG: toxin-antitoxin system HicB family antitoxin [Lachnospiraceae bacterium]|nr:toxin-antitoxin system HicB family antitoxin [Lachnospiraceae bacterium]